MIEAILKLLRASEAGKLQSAAVYHEQIDQIDLAAAAEAVDAARARRDAVLLRADDGAADEADREVAAAVREHDRLRVALGELQRLAAEAEAREKAADLDAFVSDAQQVQTRMIGEFVELDQLATQLCSLLDRLDAGQESLRQANERLVEGGRPDLRVPHPLRLLAEHMGRQPGSIAAQHTTWTLAGYRPHPHPDHPYSHFRELLPAAVRRKAA